MLQQKSISRNRQSGNPQAALARTRKPDEFQKKVIRLLAGRTDARVECLLQGEQILPILYYAATLTKRNLSSVKMLLITASTEDALSYEAALKTQPRLAGRPLRMAALPDSQPDRTQIQAISRQPDIVAGIAPRIIDHLRLGSLSLSGLNTMIIDSTNAPLNPPTALDISFIRSKTSPLTRLFHFYGQEENSTSILKPYTKIIRAMDQYKLWNNFFRFPVTDPKNVLSALQKPDFRRRFFFIGYHGGIDSGIFRDCKGLAEQVSPQPGQFEAITTAPEPVVMMENPPAEYGALLHFLSEQGIMTIFFSQQESTVLKKTIKEFIMQAKKIKIDNETELRAKIQDVMKKVRQKEDVFEMTEYKKLFHKNVSIFLRSYFAAYCIKYFLNNGRGTSIAAPVSVPKRETASPSTSASSQPASALSGDFQTLFVSVGKNRKVFPRDLSKLFSTELDIKPTDLGEINIFEKYAFIDIPTSIAQKAIDKVNGQNYRGRKIVVNFARKKD